MVRYQVILAYDGSQFQGFQRQANTRTVQGVVEDALRRLNWRGRTILAAGRTDTGVHAAGQVIAFDLEWAHSPQELQAALNAHLPLEVAARQVQATHADFHPRRDARWRRYRYQIYCQPVRHPLLDPFAWRVWPPASLPSLQTAASLLTGKHDFAAFGTPPRAASSTVRTVMQATWEDNAPYFTFEVTGNAFLYHMVRRLVFLQVAVAQDRLPLQAIAQALQPTRLANGEISPRVQGLAPPQGLTLAEVRYRPRVEPQADNQDDQGIQNEGWPPCPEQQPASDGEHERAEDIHP